MKIVVLRVLYVYVYAYVYCNVVHVRVRVLYSVLPEVHVRVRVQYEVKFFQYSYIRKYFRTTCSVLYTCTCTCIKQLYCTVKSYSTRVHECRSSGYVNERIGA